MPAPKKRLGKGSQRLKFKDVSPKAEKEEQEMLNKKGYGGKMKKKPVAMKGGGILGALGGGMPLMGIIPQMIHHNKKKKNKGGDPTKDAALNAAEKNKQIMQAAAARGKQPSKMKYGGKCRGMGAATRGGDFMRDG